MRSYDFVSARSHDGRTLRLLGAMESSAALATRNFTTIDCTSTRVETYPLAAMFLMISIIRGELGASAEESAYPLACGENIQFVA